MTDISYTLSRANQGDKKSQCFIGRMYAEGRYIPQDYLEAFFWLSLASAAGENKAYTLRDRMAGKLSSEQVLMVKNRVDNWKPQPKTFGINLSRLSGNTVKVSDGGACPEPGQASVLIAFSDGTKLQGTFWRIIKDGKAYLSSFDHQQQYGLPAPIDAKAELSRELDGKSVIVAQMDKETGDLVFDFTDGLKLQVFSFTGYEIWTIYFADGTVDYSNHARF